MLAVATPAGVYFYDAATGRELESIYTDIPVSLIDISPDGRWLAVADKITVRIWDVEKREESNKFSGMEGSIDRLIISPDNHHLALERRSRIFNFQEGTSGETTTVELWNLKSGKLIYTFTNSDFPLFNSDGSILGVRSDDAATPYFMKRITFWNTLTGELIYSVEGIWFAFNPNGETVVVETQNDLNNGISILLDIETWQPLFTFEGEIPSPHSNPFNSTGSIMSTYQSSTNDIEMWNTVTGEKLNEISGHRGHIWAMFNPKNNIIATYGALDTTAKLWDETTGELLYCLQGFNGDLGDFSPDGRFLIERRWYQGTIALWDMNTGRIALILDKHTPHASSVAFSPDGKYIASGHDYGFVYIWSVETGQHLSTFQGFSFVHDVEFSSDGKRLAAVGIIYTRNNHEEAKVEIWETDSGQSIFSWNSQNQDKTWMTDIAFSPDGKTMAAGSSDGLVRLWDLSSNQIIYVIITPKSYSGPGIEFSPRSAFFAFHSSDEHLDFFDIELGKRLKSLYIPGEPSYIGDFSFSFDGETFAATDNNTVWIWDISTQFPIALSIENAGKSISSIAISPDGKLLAVAGVLSTEEEDFWGISLWDIENQQKLVEVSGFQEWIPKIVFPPDGHLLASASADGTIRLWGVQP